MPDQLTRRVEQHVALLNDGVRSGDFAPFLATFAAAALRIPLGARRRGDFSSSTGKMTW